MCLDDSAIQLHSGDRISLRIILIAAALINKHVAIKEYNRLLAFELLTKHPGDFTVRWLGQFCVPMPPFIIRLPYTHPVASNLPGC